MKYRGCPRDAELEIRKICDWISEKNGGRGVVRELYRAISIQLVSGEENEF